MSSKREFLDFVLEGLYNISFKVMMGEFILYYKGKIIGGIYDDRLLIKKTKSAEKIIKNIKYGLPYPNAKEMILIENLEDKKYLMQLFKEIYQELYVKGI
ncbi:transcriptional regulator [Campylobacter fetus]|nr:transcriptional regulator [Campylobacter fetus]